MKKNGKLIVMGIEGTAHTSGVGIVNEKCKVLANEKDSYTSDKGGMIPRELAEHHAEKFPEIVKRAMQKAKLEWKDIDCIAYSAGPGMGPALSTTAVTARALALLHNKDVVPVNHCVAHIEIAKKLANSKDPLVIYVSGGNSQIIGYDSGKYRVYGETLDIGVGNLLDSFGRELGMGFPAGPKMDKMYFEKHKYIQLPYTVKGMDTIFSGLYTAAKVKIGKEKKEDLVYSLMHNAFAMLTESTERALAHTGKNELLLTGGVGASKALQKILKEMCSKRKVKFKACPIEYASDNGAMIAWTGALMAKVRRGVKPEKAFTNQKFRTDMEKIDWM